MIKFDGKYYLDTKDLCKILNILPRTAHKNYLRTGKIKNFKSKNRYHIKKKDLEDYLTTIKNGG